MTTNDKRDDNISHPKITFSQNEEGLVRDDTTDELYMPLSSTIVLKWTKKDAVCSSGFRKLFSNRCSRFLRSLC